MAKERIIQDPEEVKGVENNDNTLEINPDKHWEIGKGNRDKNLYDLYPSSDVD